MFRPGALRFEATIGAGHKMVQLPTGFAYDDGDVVVLTQREAEMLNPDAIGAGQPIATLTPVSPVEVQPIGDLFVYDEDQATGT